MGHLLRFAILLLVAKSSITICSSTSSVVRQFEALRIVPDVIPNAPTSEIQVTYQGGLEVKLGNELTPTQVKDAPSVSWDAKPDNYYTLVMTDPDAMFLGQPVEEWCHWLVGNIPGNNVAAGKTVIEYMGSGPSEGSGLHRYVFLIYQQPGKLIFNDALNNSVDSRGGFLTTNFATEYNLGDPVNGNFYQAQYDDYVPVLLKQLGY